MAIEYRHFQFTYELKSNNFLSFLDIFTKHNYANFCVTLVTSVHCKNTATDQYLNFFSNCPLSYKYLLSRLFYLEQKYIVMNMTLFFETKRIFSNLINNDYFINWLKRTLQAFLYPRTSCRPINLLFFFLLLTMPVSLNLSHVSFINLISFWLMSPQDQFVP